MVLGFVLRPQHAQAALLGEVIGGWLAWLLGALLATWTYLGVAALEVAAARTLHITVGEEDPAER